MNGELWTVRWIAWEALFWTGDEAQEVSAGGDELKDESSVKQRLLSSRLTRTLMKFVSNSVIKKLVHSEQ